MEERPTSVVREMLRAFPHLRVSPFVFIVSLLLTFVAVLCDGAALALLGPLLQRVIHEASQQPSSIANQNELIQLIFSTVGLRQDSSFLTLVSTVLFLSIIAIPLRKFASLLMEHTAKGLQHRLPPALIAFELQYGKLYFQLKEHVAMYELCILATQYFATGLRLLHRSIEATAFVVFYLCIMFSISIVFTVYFVVAGFILVILSTFFRRRVAKLRHADVESGKLLRRQIVACFESYEVIKGNALESNVSKTVEKLANARLKISLQISRLTFFSSVAQDILSLLVIFLAVTMYIYSSPEITSAIAANAAVFLVLSRRILQPISVLNTSYLEAAKLEPGRSALREILTLDDKLIPYSGNIPVPHPFPDIKIQNLHFSYPSGFAALRGITTSIPSGATVAVVGRSGAGKTTLMNVLLKSFEIAPNCVLLGECDLREIDREQWGRSLAFIPQNTTLFAGTLRENLCLSLEYVPTDDQLQDALDRVLLSELPKNLELGFDTIVGEGGGRLSRGEQQRVSIARTFLQNPQLVLIDEATAALDVSTEFELLRSLHEFCRGRTAVIIAHRLATIRYADTILVIDDGMLVEEGSFDELCSADGLFAEFWRKHSESEDFRIM